MLTPLIFYPHRNNSVTSSLTVFGPAFSRKTSSLVWLHYLGHDLHDEPAAQKTLHVPQCILGIGRRPVFVL